MTDANPQIGGRIRRLRRQRHIAQAALAEAVGISASYLNLIEHNRRAITVPLLFKFSGYFGIEPGELAETDDARLVGDLMEMFGDEAFADADVTNQDIRDLAQAHPVVARAVLQAFDRSREARKHGEVGAIVSGEDGIFHRATDQISDFLQENANHFPTLEAAAERVRADIDHASDDFAQGIRTYLLNVFGIDWRITSLPRGLARRLSTEGRTLEVSDLLREGSALFTVCHHLGLMAADREIRQIIEVTDLPDGDAPALARNVLASYFAAALIMPYESFYRACMDFRYDVERIAHRFSQSFEQVCHRMTTLQRPGMAGIPLHLVRTDIAGNISKRFSLSGIHIPRHSGACPRWNVYSAFLQPGRINIQLSQMPDGQTYFCIARSFEKGGYRHNAPRRHFSIGLGCHVTQAHRMVYADGLDLKTESQVVPIGVGCRICPRMECDQRAHPPANHRFTLEDGVKSETLYGRIR